MAIGLAVPGEWQRQSLTGMEKTIVFNEPLQNTNNSSTNSSATVLTS